MSKPSTKGDSHRTQAGALFAACCVALVLLSGCTAQGAIVHTVSLTLYNDSETPVEGVLVEVSDGRRTVATTLVDRLEPFATARLDLEAATKGGAALSIQAGDDENGRYLQDPCPGDPWVRVTMRPFPEPFSNVTMIHIDSNCEGTWSP